MRPLPLLAALALLAGACARPDPAPAQAPAKRTAQTPAATDQGRYVVERVLTDPAIDNAEQRYFADDPRLLGRTVTIAAARAEIDDGTGACTELRRRIARQTPAAARAAELSRRGAGRALHPTPADMGLAAGSAPVAVARYTCAGPGEVPPGRIWTGAAAFAAAKDRLALVWESEVVLLLAPASAAPARPPSFACARAASASEKAICADPGLSSWDRSVAAALRMARDGSDELGAAEDPAALMQAQQAWLVQRDACGADTACLTDRMAERTAALLGKSL